jgi:hypothetical protein
MPFGLRVMDCGLEKKLRGWFVRRGEPVGVARLRHSKSFSRNMSLFVVVERKLG